MQSLRDELVGEELIGEYLLWNFNQNGQYLYKKKYALGTVQSPIESYETVLRGIGRAIGSLHHKGQLDRDRAAKKFISDYRSGKLGQMTLDVLPSSPPTEIEKKV